MTDFFGRENAVKITPPSLFNFPQRSHLYGTSANHSDSDKLSIIQDVLDKHKFKENFIDPFDDYAKKHRKNDNRHLPCCFTKFKGFI